jgi:hypothetical protein
LSPKHNAESRGVRFVSLITTKGHLEESVLRRTGLRVSGRTSGGKVFVAKRLVTVLE